MKKILILLVSFSLLLYSCQSTESYSRSGFDFSSIDKVAVLDVQGKLKSEAAKNQIADFFTMELLKKGYSPIERSRVQAILKEQEFQASESTTSDEAVKMGEILNVPVVMMVSVPEFSENVTMTAKLVDVEDGSILWMGSGEGSTNKTLATIAGAAAGVAVGIGVTGEDDDVVGGVAGGVLGGVAGRMLTPQEAKMAQEIIKKMCKDLPQK